MAFFDDVVIVVVVVVVKGRDLAEVRVALGVQQPSASAVGQRQRRRRVARRIFRRAFQHLEAGDAQTAVTGRLKVGKRGGRR